MLATAHFSTTLLFLCGWDLGALYLRKGFRDRYDYGLSLGFSGFVAREIFGSGKVLVAISIGFGC